MVSHLGDHHGFPVSCIDGLGCIPRAEGSNKKDSFYQNFDLHSEGGNLTLERSHRYSSIQNLVLSVPTFLHVILLAPVFLHYQVKNISEETALTTSIRRAKGSNKKDSFLQKFDLHSEGGKLTLERSHRYSSIQYLVLSVPTFLRVILLALVFLHYHVKNIYQRKKSNQI